MNFFYCIIEENLFSNDLGSYKTYGILAIGKSTNKQVEHFVSDVSPDRERLAAFVDLCNKQKLDICHLHDAVEDFLATK